jgi:tetratricopeptide (TPR) repeat protein
MNAALEIATALHCQGRHSEAETEYREALRIQPDAFDAIRGLGELAYQDGRVEEAMALFARGVAIQPEAADLHSNLAETLRILNRTDEAVKYARMALALDPTLPDAWNTMGLLAHEQGRLGDAETAFREAIRVQPEHWFAYNNLGNTLRAMRRHDDAAESFRAAIRLEPRSAAALTNLAQVLIEIGDPALLDQAEELCRRALAVAPELTQAINSLGNVLLLQGRLDDAMSCYQHALQIDPGRVASCLNIGNLFRRCGRYADAACWFEKAQIVIPDPARDHANRGSLCADREQFDDSARSYRLALAHDSHSAEAHQGLGVALLEQGRLDEAETSFHEAIRLEPSQPAPWVCLARLRAERGDFELSCRAARQALALRPSMADAYVQLAFNLKDRLPVAEVEAIEDLLLQKYLPEGSRSRILFGLAGIHDARRDYAAAAVRLETANAAQTAARAARGQHEDPELYTRFVGRLIATMTPDLIGRGRGWGDPDPRPVFVVGLPRSGTMLIEQIIATHPRGDGVGELPDVRRVFKSLPALVGRPFAEPCDALFALDSASAMAAARRYLDSLNTLARPGAVRVVDKMPDNIDLLGLIALLWPGARVIVCHRNLRDVALSCWQTGFASIHWANDYQHIARRFADYQRILDHWRHTKPLTWLDVSYEKLVRDTDAQTRRLIDFLDLEWDPVCLQFHSTRRVVRTASQSQVHQPIHSASVGRWRNYERLLEPLFGALDSNGVDVEACA